jgi:hypothetical protein
MWLGYKTVAGSGQDDFKATYYALNEFDQQHTPPEQVKAVLETEWAKKVVSSATSVQPDRWEFIAEAGATETKL